GCFQHWRCAKVSRDGDARPAAPRQGPSHRLRGPDVMTFAGINLSPEVADAVRAGRPVVALESTLIAHGLPWPVNYETAMEAEAVVRAEGAIPATIAVWQGTPTVGLSASCLERLARHEEVI